jgi:hypothetical protein
MKIRHLIRELNGNVHGINLSMTGLVEWFMKHMSIIWTEKINYEIKIDITQHVLKMQEIPLLPKYIKWIIGGVF